MLKPGIKGYTSETVTENQTAKAVGSGELQVYATPCMIALLEKTAWESVAGNLEEGQGTVGTRLDVYHVSANPVGMKVWCETELIEIDGRRLVFAVKAYDEAGLIGEGTHERFIVWNERFQQKAEGKR